MPFKIYEVELKRTSYVTYNVQALDENNAEDEAWRLLEEDFGADNGDADWEVNAIWETDV